jgi:16S rRNA (adenine1518-N6/adenine1519-N6)-dimethyltransferase
VRKSIPALLRAYDLKPRKGLGQNFLLDPRALGRILDAADLASDDIVVEVGSGLGTLTQPLARQVGLVVAIEIDPHLVAVLHEQLAGEPNVQILEGDILRMRDLPVHHLGYKVVANLPYYITSAILRHFLETEPRPSLMVVTVQREVADRIVATAGAMSVLAVSVQFYGRPSIVSRIPAGAFHPPPKVDSAVLRIEIDETPRVMLADGLTDFDYFRVVRAGFGQKRKTLRNALSSGLGLSPSRTEEALRQARVEPRRRAETLDLREWAEVVRSLHLLNDAPQTRS